MDFIGVALGNFPLPLLDSFRTSWTAKHDILPDRQHKTKCDNFLSSFPPSHCLLTDCLLILRVHTHSMTSLPPPLFHIRYSQLRPKLSMYSARYINLPSSSPWKVLSIPISSPSLIFISHLIFILYSPSSPTSTP